MSEQLSVRVRISVSMVAAFVMAWSASAATTKIKTDYDRTFSFAGLRTWSWHPDGAGDVRVAVSSQDDPKQISARVDPVIVPAVEKELSARGLMRVADQASLHLHYYALATVQQFSQQHGQFLAPVTDWGVPPFVASTSALSVYPVGTLIVDVTAPGRTGVVWRGSAQRSLDLERPESERRRVLERAIADLFRKFPPKK